MLWIQPYDGEYRDWGVRRLLNLCVESMLW
jgi:hypothetical protein